MDRNRSRLRKTFVRRYKWCILLLSLILLLGCDRATGTELPYTQELQEVLDSARESAGLMGVSSAVIVPGYEPWLGVSGESYAGRPVTADMLFDMGSAGKMIVGPLMVALVEDDLLSLDDPIDKYLPDFPYADGSITIRQLLNHTNGLYMMVDHPDSPFKKPYAEIDHEHWWTIDEIFTNLGGEPYFLPGEGYCYTQAGYQLAILIIEEVTGTSVGTQIQTRLFDPLGIDSMHLDFSRPVPEHFDIAHPWVDVDFDGDYDDVYDRSRNWIASLSRILFYTQAGDFARWGHALFSGDVFDQGAMEEVLDFFRMDDWCGDAPLIRGYGLGVQDFDPALVRGQPAWGHMGSIPGYRAFLAHLHQHGVTMAVMTNTDSDDAMMVVDGLLEVILDHLDVEAKALQPIEVIPVKQVPEGASVIETFQKETLFCDHNPVWEVAASPGDWIDISLDWVVGTDREKAENAWGHHTHTVTINGEEIGDLESYAHEVENYTVTCMDETLDIWAKRLSIFLPPLPVGEYEVKWYSQITGEFNNGWVTYKPGDYMNLVAYLTVK